jgi:hypothetical protein
MAEKPYNFIDEKKCSCGETKLKPAMSLEPKGTVYDCPKCGAEYDQLGSFIGKRELEKQEEVQQSLNACPFMSNPPEAMQECIRGHCHMWSDSSPFFGMEPGMCSLVLAGEAMAFMSRSEGLRGMGDREQGGRAG